MIPTVRVYILLIVAGGLAMLLAWLWPGSNRLVISLLLLLVLNAIVLALMLFDRRNGRAQLVTVERLPIQRLSIGRENLIQLAIENPGPATQVMIRDGYPQPHFIVSADTLSLQLAANATEKLSYTVQPTMRGEYNWGVLQVRQCSPWGLVWMAQTLPPVQTVQVYPDLMSLRSLTLKLALSSAGAMRQKRRLGIGTEFTELRDYNAGDDPRLIDWKATARRDRPLVRVLSRSRNKP